MANIDRATVAGFGREWQNFDQTALPDKEGRRLFTEYFGLFDFTDLGEGFDLGCGSGRWAKYVAPHAKLLHCIDPSDAIDVARRNLSEFGNVRFHRASADDIPLEDGSQSFGYCLGVLHHIPDPEAALRKAVAKLRPGGQFLLYVYYRFDNRPAWYRAAWRVTDIGRRIVSRLPFPLKRAVAFGIAATIYWPLSKLRTPLLSSYRKASFYTMKTDALDRFGTRLELRFTKREIRAMMERSGLSQIRFSNHPPYWVAVGRA